MGVVAELVKRGTGWREHDVVACDSDGGGRRASALQCAAGPDVDARAGEGVLQGRGVGANGVDGLDANSGGVDEGGVAGPLAHAADDEVHPAVEAPQGGDGGVDVGRLGVIPPTHPAVHADPLQTVRNARIGGEAGDDVFVADARQNRDGGGGGGVLAVVMADNERVVDVQDAHGVSVADGQAQVAWRAVADGDAIEPSGDVKVQRGGAGHNRWNQRVLAVGSLALHETPPIVSASSQALAA